MDAVVNLNADFFKMKFNLDCTALLWSYIARVLCKREV